MIADLSCGMASQIIRTFTVPTSTIIGDVDVGVFLTHSYRSDLRITLTSPAGTSVTVMTWPGNVQSGDNLNDRFDHEAAAALSAHVGNVTDPLTPVPPPYAHSFQPSSPFSAFDGQNAQGIWTMVLCDAVAVDIGTFARADLFIASTNLSVSKSSQILSDGVNASSWKALPGAAVRYCILVTNTGGATHSNIAASDVLPASLSFVPGSMATGTSCTGPSNAEDDDNTGADEADPAGMAIAGSTILGTAPSLAANTAIAFLFRATIN